MSTTWGPGEAPGSFTGTIGGDWNPVPVTDFNQGGGYDPRLDPGIPSIGNIYGGGGDLYGNNPTGFVVPPIAGGGGNSSLGSLGNFLPALNSLLGMGNSSSIMPLLSLLAPLLGGMYAQNKTNQATGQVVNAINSANSQVKGLLGGPSIYSPYMQSGQAALGNLGKMNWTPINFGSLSGKT